MASLLRVILLLMHLVSLALTNDKCFDVSEQCGHWESIGECENNADYMRKTCPKTCQACRTNSVLVAIQDNSGGDKLTPLHSGASPQDCKNLRSECPQWASVGECAKNHMYMNAVCYRSCSDCRLQDKKPLQATSDSSDASSLADDVCADSNDQCQHRAMTGECWNNKDYMRKHCFKTCSKCSSDKHDCEDLHTRCAKWASDGECTNNPGYMLRGCPKSCKECAKSSEDCADLHRHCADWALIGECDINPGYMHDQCPHSCSVCGGLSADAIQTVALSSTAASASHSDDGVASNHDVSVPNSSDRVIASASHSDDDVASNHDVSVPTSSDRVIDPRGPS